MNVNRRSFLAAAGVGLAAPVLPKVASGTAGVPEPEITWKVDEDSTWGEMVIVGHVEGDDEPVMRLVYGINFVSPVLKDSWHWLVYNHQEAAPGGPYAPGDCRAAHREERTGWANALHCAMEQALIIWRYWRHGKRAPRDLGAIEEFLATWRSEYGDEFRALLPKVAGGESDPPKPKIWWIGRRKEPSKHHPDGEHWSDGFAEGYPKKIIQIRNSRFRPPECSWFIYDQRGRCVRTGWAPSKPDAMDDASVVWWHLYQSRSK
jgi:hypothetical protein